jgi:hypothetical protein
MKCGDIELLSVDYLSNRLPDQSRRELEVHVSECQPCRLELERARAAWVMMNALPAAEPGPGLRKRFDAMLSAEKRRLSSRTEERPSWMQAVLSRVRRPAIGFAMPVALLALGFLGGFTVRGSLPGKGEMSSMRAEVTEMRRMLSLSLLDHPSSSERLRGVQVSRQMEGTDDTVLEALLNTLSGDPSTNVRLAAVDALFLFRDRPRVREALIRSLARQSSPLVQVSIIDLLVEIRERKAADALRFLIRSRGTDPTVRQRAEWGISRLI